MRIVMGMLMAAALTVGTWRPSHAQCNGWCSGLRDAEGNISFTCSYASGSNVNCTSIPRGCRLTMCETALLTNPAGQTIGLASLCSGNVTVRSLANAPKPRIAAKLRQQRGTATLAVARKARAPSAG